MWAKASSTLPISLPLVTEIGLRSLQRFIMVIITN